MVRQTVEDLRFSLRLWKAWPGFATLVVSILALGIAANTILFTVVNGLILRPLPYQRPDSLVHISQIRGGLPVERLQGAHSFEDPAQFVARNFEVAAAETRFLFGFRASANLFDVLGVSAALGRTFLPGDEREPVVILSYEYWRRISGDPNIIGQTLNIDNQQRTVVGVLPSDFTLGVRDGNLWIPYPQADGNVISRLRPSVSAAQAESEVSAILAGSGINRDSDTRVRVRPLSETMRPGAAGTYLLLQAAVGFVLLISCANVANLLLVRSSARRREFAIRAAIGAGKARLLRQLLTESTLLALAGGAFGLLLANWGLEFLKNWLPVSTTRLIRGAVGLAIDQRIIGFAVGVSLLTVLLFGLAPAIRAVRFDVMTSLRDTAKGSGPDRQRFGQALVAGEVALALMLLIGAALTLKSLIGLEHQNLGFSADHVLRAAVEFPASRFLLPEQRQAKIAETVRRLSALQGVETIGVLAPQFFPFGGPMVRGSIFEIQGQPNIEPRAEPYTANPSYFSAVRIPLLRGRLFAESDTTKAAPVALISNVVARRYWGGDDPVGRQIRFGANEPWVTIVGIVGDVRNPIGLDVQPTAYFPLAQKPTAGVVLMIRTTPDPLTLAEIVRKELHAIDPAAPQARVASLALAVSDYISPQRFTTSVLGFFAALGLILAALGIYGVIRYWVGARVSEIGVRVALGANRIDVLRLVLSRAAITAGIGIALGLAGAAALQRWIASQLYGVSPVDPAVLAWVSVAMALVALFAAFLPARWASKIDPVVALRHE